MARRFGRSNQMWPVAAACYALFALFLWLIPAMNWPLFWRVMLAALVSSAICLTAVQWWLRTVLSRRRTTVELLNRITSGDLAVSTPEIAQTTESTHMASALRALVINLDRKSTRLNS